MTEPRKPTLEGQIRRVKQHLAWAADSEFIAVSVAEDFDRIVAKLRELEKQLEDAYIRERLAEKT